MRNVKWQVGRIGAGLALGVLVLTGAGCSDVSGDGDDGFNADEWKKINEISPLATAAPPNPSNLRATDATLAKLGQMLFFELDFSGPIKADNPNGMMGEAGKVGCVTCHDPNKYFIDSDAT